MSSTKNILLVCTAGITTGLLVRNMKTEAKEKGLDINIFSTSAISAQDVLQEKNIDGVLIGPQAEYDVKNLKNYFKENHIPNSIISNKTFEILDGKGALDEALALFD